MDCNKEEAIRSKGIAEKKLQNRDFQQARKMALRAQQLDPSMDNICQLVMVCDVHCSAEKKFGNEMDWYGILQVQQSADEATIKKQYRKFALLLHPDKNNLPGAEAAFKLIGEAQRILLDHNSRIVHDRKRNAFSRIPGSQSMSFTRFPEPYQPPHGTNWKSNVGVQSHPQSNFSGFSTHSQPSAQAGVFNAHQTFWTSCPFCKMKYQYYRNIINKSLTCQTCKKVFVAYDISLSGASQAAFSQQGPFGNETKVNIGSKSTSLGCKKGGPFSRTSNPTVKSRKINSRGRMQKENSGESHILDTKSTSDSENESVMCNDSESKSNQVNNKRSFEQGVRRSTRQRHNVSYKETGSDEDDAKNTSKQVRGGGESLREENGAQEEAKLKRDNCVGRDPGVETDRKLDETIRPEEIKPESGTDGCSDQCDSNNSEDSCVPLSNTANGSQVPEPEFYNFDDAKSPSNFEVGQIWALYSDEDSLPKYYGLITDVTTQPKFQIQLSWLCSKSLPKGAIKWQDRKMLISCGSFKIDKCGQECYSNANPFSHCLNVSTSWENNATFIILPRKGEIWALYKSWNSGISYSALENCDYDLVEVIEADGSVIKVMMLERLCSFPCVWRPQSQGSSKVTLQIPMVEILRFSHNLPAFQLTEEKQGSLKGFWEVDPLALPARFFAPN